MMNDLMLHWEKIAIVVAPVLTWLFKTRVYDKLELKQKEVSVRSDGANVVEKNLDLYQEMIDDMDKRHKEQLDRKEREISKILNKQKKPITELKYHRLFQVVEQVGKRVEGIHFITHGEVDKVKTMLMNVLIQEKLANVSMVFTDFLDAVYLIESYEEYRLDLVNGFLESLDDISTNDDYSSNYDKINAIYELVALSIYLIPKDVRIALDSVNGRFIKYEKVLFD